MAFYFIKPILMIAFDLHFEQIYASLILKNNLSIFIILFDLRPSQM